MEEEKEFSSRIFRKLILPNNVKLKPGPNCKTILIGSFEYSFKDFLNGEKEFSYRCVHRTPICKCCIHIPLSNFDSNFEIRDLSNICGVRYINDHTIQCKKKYDKRKEIEQNIVEAGAFSSDLQLLEQYIRNHPLLEPKNVKVEMLKQGQKFKKFQILKKIQEIRNELFPKDDIMAFTPLFCNAVDSTHPNYNLFKIHSKIPYVTKGGKLEMQEFVIFANHTMIKQMNSSNQWFYGFYIQSRS